MTQLDDSLRPVAQDMIAQFGADATYTRRTAATYDAATGKTTETTGTTAVKVVIEQLKKAFREGGTVQSGDMKGQIADSDLGFTPALGDTLTVGGVEYRVEDTMPVYSGQQVAVHMLHLRR